MTIIIIDKFIENSTCCQYSCRVRLVFEVIQEKANKHRIQCLLSFSAEKVFDD